MNAQDLLDEAVSATSKLVKAWESKTNQRAMKAGGGLTMALTLAACGGSDSTTTTPVETPTTPASSAALTADDDLISGAAGVDDNITSDKNGLLNDGDTVIDPSTSDDDTVTASFNNGDDMTGTPTITNIENVDLSFNMLNGATFDATDVTGANITMSLTNAQTDGAAEVTANANGNAVTAGTGVKSLTVAGSDEGLVVNAGAATTIDITTVDGDADTSTSVAVNSDGGSVALVVDQSVATTYAFTTINAAADAVFTVTGSDFGSGTDAVVTAANSTGAVVLKGTAAELATADKFVNVDLTVTDTTAATLELGTSTVGTINVTDNTGQLTLNDLVSGTVNMTTDESQDVVVVGKAASSSATINIETNTPTLSATTGSFTINTTDAVNTFTSLTVGGASTLNTTGNTTVSLLDNNGTTGDALTITGTGNVTVSDTSTHALKVTASNDGTFTFTSTDDLAHTIIGAAGVNTISVENSTESVTITTQDSADSVTFAGTIGGIVSKQTVTTAGGDDTVTVEDASAAAGKTTIDLGAGDDTIKLGSVTAVTLAGTASDVLTIKGGDGDDTIKLISLADLTQASGTLAISGVENITMATAATIDAKTLDGASYSINGSATVASDDLTVTIADAADATIDLSGLTINANLESISIDLSALTGGIAHTLEGTNGADDIEGSTLADVVNAGAGNDTYTSNVAMASGVTVDLGAGNDTFEMIYDSATASSSATVTLGAGNDKLDLTDFDTGDLGAITVTDFVSGEDKILIDIADTSYTLAAGDILKIGDASDLALALDAVIIGAEVTNFIISDTSANLAGVDVSATTGSGVVNTAVLVFDETTSELYLDDDGNLSSGMELLATLTGVTTLTAADFTVA